MAIVESALRLLFRALLLEINKMSTSLLALGVGLAVVAFKLHAAHRRGKWPAVMNELRQDTWKGAAAALGIWIVLFFVFLGATIYQDHEEAKKEIKQLAGKLYSNEQGKQIETLNNTIAAKDSTIHGLEAQTKRDQDIINNLIVQVGKAQAPEPLKIIGHELLGLMPQGTMAGFNYAMPWVVISNKTISPVKLLVTCEANNIEATGHVIGSGVVVGGGWGGRVTLRTNQYGVGIPSPAWSPSSPLLVTVYSNTPRSGPCRFEEQ